MDQLQSAWEYHIDTHTDPNGVPYDDEAHQQAEARRNAEGWAAYEPVALLTERLVISTESRLATLPGSVVQARWGSQLSALTAATRALTVVRTTWDDEITALPPDARPGNAAYDTVTAERDTAVWPLLEEWALHGQAVLDIRAAAGTERTRMTTRAPAPPATTRSSPTVRR
ncbi:hypothetical protein ABZ714_11375 [Streptomyces sp. NPDC006798]|uniref:hypothetical protein n=1 Tax=Streptomyces sp. NPDC006798 TaxID=3155462 RepID=UPI0034050ACA